MAFHKLLGKILAAFKHGTRLGRTYDGYAGSTLIGFKVIIYTFYQRILGTNHNHIDAVFYREFFQGFKIIGFDVHVLANVGCTCISRCDEQFIHFLALCYLPCQGVLSSSAS